MGPYVVISAYPSPSSSNGGGKTSSTPLSFAKSRTIPNTLAPVWNDDFPVTSTVWNGTLVLTLFDSDMLSKDDFLGQTVVDLRRCQELYSGKVVEFSDTAIESLSVHITDGAGKPLIAPGSQTMEGKGKISFSLRLPSLAYSMCGWLWKASTGLMSKGSWKKRWVILAEFKLSYYEGPFNLHEVKDTISCTDITSIVEEDTKKDGKAIRISYGRGKDYWLLRWDTDAPEYVHKMWLRKLLRSCPNVRDDELAVINPRLAQTTSSPKRALVAAAGELK